MNRARLLLAKALFAVANRFCKAEINQIIADLAISVASKAAVQATRAAFVSSRIAVCGHPECTQRHGLRRMPSGYFCQIHAATTERQLAPATI